MDFQQFYSPLYSLYRDRNFIGMIHDILDTIIIIIISFIFFRLYQNWKCKWRKRGARKIGYLYLNSHCVNFAINVRRFTHLPTPEFIRTHYCACIVRVSACWFVAAKHTHSITLIVIIIRYNLTFISIIGGRRGIYISFSTRGTRVSGKRPAAWNLPPLITHSRLNIVEETGV